MAPAQRANAGPIETCRPDGATIIATPDPTDRAPLAGRAHLLIAVGAVAALRLVMCARVPVNTGDILRHIHTALYVLRDGPAVAGVPLVQLDAGLQGLSWAGAAYSYPPLVLPFFTIVAALSPTLFAAKLALTLVEAANAALVARITSSRWLGVLYWALPSSIWWVSGEGQFEPLMALFMLAAVALVRSRPVAALALIALGFHVKLTAVLLVPWLVVTVWRERPEALVRAGLAFVAALVLPVLVAGIWYPVVQGIVGIASTVRFNPYYWNVFDDAIFRWMPPWLRIANALASCGVLAFMLVQAGRTRAWWAYGGAIALLLLVKVSALAQFWYLLLLPAFVMPVEREPGRLDARLLLLALVPLLDVYSLVELVAGPFGWIEVGLYDGLSAFTSFGVR